MTTTYLFGHPISLVYMELYDIGKSRGDEGGVRLRCKRTGVFLVLEYTINTQVSLMDDAVNCQTSRIPVHE